MALERMIPDIGEIPQFPVEQFQLSDWRDGLLVRSPNWLGDAVMTLPALSVLRKTIPHPCGLFVACPKGIADLFRMMPIIDEVVPLEDPHSFPSKSEWKKVRWLMAGIALIFNNSFRDALWLKSAKIPKLYGTGARFRSFLMERTFAFPPRLDHELNKPHQAAKYLSMALALGAPQWDGSMPEIRAEYHPELCCDELQQALNSDKLLALAPGAAYGAAKRWDPESFHAVADWWIREQHGKVALLCSGKEADEARKTITGFSADSCFDLAGKTSLESLVLVLHHSRGCIANDSGIMHLAAALGVPGVAPFGSTDPAATSPLSAKWRLLFDKQPCAPCFKRVCPYGTRACMKAISPDDVIKTIAEIF